jgi:tetratricopeptide (TPR) repeat protein
MRQGIITIILLGLTLSLYGQKSKVLAVMQMIDAGKYDEAKEDIEQALQNEKTSSWNRTYYAKGLLCQTAYESGIEKKETKKASLYPDQLFLAYDSYEKALELDVRERLKTNIGQKYYLLANDFRNMGEELYEKREYNAALRAFEHALMISNSDLVSAKTDTSLVYNTAMAAYQSKNWEKAIQYLKELQQVAHSTDGCTLLAMSYFESGDTLRGEKVLREGVKTYNYEEPVVMFLMNRLDESGRPVQALVILNSAIEARPDNFRFYWARGLVYQKMGRNDEAIESFLKAVERSPDSPELYYHLGICYYNMGIDLRESALHILEEDEYMEAREQYLEKFRKALKWLEKSYELDPDNEDTVSTLNQLNYQLHLKQKQQSSQELNDR